MLAVISLKCFVATLGHNIWILFTVGDVDQDIGQQSVDLAVNSWLIVS